MLRRRLALLLISLLPSARTQCADWQGLAADVAAGVYNATCTALNVRC